MKVIIKVVSAVILAILMINICFLNKVEALSYNAVIIQKTDAVKDKEFVISINIQGDKRYIQS